MFGLSVHTLALIGVCSIFYCIYRLFLFLSLYLDDSGKDQPVLDLLFIGCRFIFALLSLPVWVVFSFFENTSIRRLNKQHEKDMSLSFLIYAFKCSHCYSHSNSSSRPFGFDNDSNTWTDREYSNLYVPSGHIPVASRSDSIDRLSSDLFSALSSCKPFRDYHIGQQNPYTQQVIESEDDYYAYLHDVADNYAHKSIDPSIYFD